MKSILKTGVLILIIAITGIFVFAVGLYVWGDWHDDWSGYNGSAYVSDGICNIAVIPITGDITTVPMVDVDGYNTTSADEVVAMIKKAEKDELIQGIMLQIDSGGGYPVASEIITNEVKRSTLPSVALIREFGDSGAYLIATGADTIIASRLSEVGSIGITMSYVQYAKQNENDGAEFISLSSGKYKDYLNPDKALTAEERTLVERDLQIWHDEFVQQVSTNRSMANEKVHELADGSAMASQIALQNGLIDSLGDKEAARQWFATLLKLTPEEIEFCE